MDRREYDLFVYWCSIEGKEGIFVLAKGVFQLAQSRLIRVAAEALFNNIYDPEEGKGLHPGCDFWPYKLATDVVVRGKAWAPRGKARQMRIGVFVNGRGREIAVFGRREVSYKGPGTLPKFSEPEPFESIEVAWENAYGGFDLRVPVERPKDLSDFLRLKVDHPGMYPRNPFGRGYVVLRDKDGIDGMELPNFEDPSHLLTPENLVVGDPRLWYRQPLPACFDWFRAHMYPRCLFFAGADAWYPVPESEKANLPEVKIGYLPPDYRNSPERFFDDPAAAIDYRFFNEAPPGMIYPYLKGGEKVLIKGMSPEGDISFDVPSPPRITIFIKGRAHTPEPVLHTLFVDTEQKKVSCLWRAFQPLSEPIIVIPGQEEKVPVEAQVDNDPPVHFAEPPPVWKSARDEKGPLPPPKKAPIYIIDDLPTLDGGTVFNPKEEKGQEDG